MMEVSALGNEIFGTKIQEASGLVSSGTGSFESGVVWGVIEEPRETARGAILRVYGRPAPLPWDSEITHVGLDELEDTGAFSIHPHPPHHVVRNYPKIRILPADLVGALKEINALKDLSEGWNGYDAANPNHEAVEKAASWLEDMHEDAMTASGSWFAPSVIADAFGNVVFEWWEHERKLTVYVTPTIVEYVKVWGPDMFSEMEDGDIEGAEDRQALWRWLMS